MLAVLSLGTQNEKWKQHNVREMLEQKWSWEDNKNVIHSNFKKQSNTNKLKEKKWLKFGKNLPSLIQRLA